MNHQNLLFCGIFFPIIILFGIVMNWTIDEGVIYTFIDSYSRTGKLSYLAQHNNAEIVFSWGYFWILKVIYQLFSTDIYLYFYLRFPNIIFLLISAYLIFISLREEYDNKYIEYTAAIIFIFFIIKSGIISIRYDAAYVFSNSVIVYLFSKLSNDNLEKRNVLNCYVITFLISVLALTTHPNALAGILILALVFAIEYKNLSIKSRIYIILVFIFSSIIMYLLLTKGLGFSYFLENFNQVRDENHNFNIINAIYGEINKHFIKLTSLKLSSIVSILIIASFFRLFSNDSRYLKLIYISILFQEFVISIQNAKFTFYDAALSPQLSILFSIYLYLFLNKVYKKLFLNKVYKKLFFFNYFVIFIVSLTYFYSVANKNFHSNSLLSYTLNFDNESTNEIKSLKNLLNDKKLSVYSDLTIIPLFSNMNLSGIYRTQPNPKDFNTPPSDDAVGIMMTPSDSFVKDLFYQNNYYNSFTVKQISEIKLFGSIWVISEIEYKR